MGCASTVGIVGAGSVGQALGRLLTTRYRVRIASRSGASEAAAFIGAGAKSCGVENLADACDCIVLAVPDRAVASVATELAASTPSAVLQTCGSLGPAALSPLPDRGVSCATFHPLQTFPDRQAGVVALPGATFGICGGGAALGWCGRLARTLDGTTIEVAEDRLPLYHAAAVVASNCMVGLVDAASSLMEEAGIDRDTGRAALRPLIESSVGNALTMDTDQALTGPVVRGDAATVRTHLEAMGETPGPLRGLYRACGRHLLAMAVRRGLAPEAAVALRLALAGKP